MDGRDISGQCQRGRALSQGTISVTRAIILCHPERRRSEPGSPASVLCLLGWGTRRQVEGPLLLKNPPHRRGEFPRGPLILAAYGSHKKLNRSEPSTGMAVPSTRAKRRTTSELASSADLRTPGPSIMPVKSNFRVQNASNPLRELSLGAFHRYFSIAKIILFAICLPN